MLPIKHHTNLYTWSSKEICSQSRIYRQNTHTKSDQVKNQKIKKSCQVTRQRHKKEKGNNRRLEKGFGSVDFPSLSNTRTARNSDAFSFQRFIQQSDKNSKNTYFNLSSSPLVLIYILFKYGFFYFFYFRIRDKSISRRLYDEFKSIFSILIALPDQSESRNEITSVQLPVSGGARTFDKDENSHRVPIPLRRERSEGGEGREHKRLPLLK